MSKIEIEAIKLRTAMKELEGLKVYASQEAKCLGVGSSSRIFKVINGSTEGVGLHLLKKWRVYLEIKVDKVRKENPIEPEPECEMSQFDKELIMEIAKLNKQFNVVKKLRSVGHDLGFIDPEVGFQYE